MTSITAAARDTRLLAETRGFEVTGGSLLLETANGGGYILLEDGGQIVLDQEIGTQLFTFMSSERDTNLIAELKDG